MGQETLGLKEYRASVKKSAESKFNFKMPPAVIEDSGITLKIKPISVNDVWKGRRFKTKLYKTYEAVLKSKLPVIKNFPLPPFRIEFEFGFSNMASDWDNPVKPIQDILQKKYKFNDKDIMEAFVKKIIVDNGKEYFKFKIVSIKV